MAQPTAQSSCTPSFMQTGTSCCWGFPQPVIQVLVGTSSGAHLLLSRVEDQRIASHRPTLEQFLILGMASLCRKQSWTKLEFGCHAF